MNQFPTAALEQATAEAAGRGAIRADLVDSEPLVSEYRGWFLRSLRLRHKTEEDDYVLLLGLATSLKDGLFHLLVAGFELFFEKRSAVRVGKLYEWFDHVARDRTFPSKSQKDGTRGTVPVTHDAAFDKRPLLLPEGRGFVAVVQRRAKRARAT